MNNLQRFSARDKTEEQELHKNAHTGVLKTATFNYLAVIDHAKSGTPIVDEYRVRTTSYENMQLMDTGTAAFALIFHPRNLPDYAVTCEGLTELEGRHAWQLHFAQYPDRDNQFHVYVVENKFYPTRLKGRVWISADDYHLLRMETDLLQPIEQIHLQREHSIIRYGPVEFHKRNLQLWLPQTTELYVDYHRHHFVRRHRFSNFQLFWVETEQQINRTIPGNAHLLGGQL